MTDLVVTAASLGVVMLVSFNIQLHRALVTHSGSAYHELGAVNRRNVGDQLHDLRASDAMSTVSDIEITSTAQDLPSRQTELSRLSRRMVPQHVSLNHQRQVRTELVQLACQRHR